MTRKLFFPNRKFLFPNRKLFFANRKLNRAVDRWRLVFLCLFKIDFSESIDFYIAEIMNNSKDSAYAGEKRSVYYIQGSREPAYAGAGNGKQMCLRAASEEPWKRQVKCFWIQCLLKVSFGRVFKVPQHTHIHGQVIDISIWMTPSNDEFATGSRGL